MLLSPAGQNQLAKMIGSPPPLIGERRGETHPLRPYLQKHHFRYALRYLVVRFVQPKGLKILRDGWQMYISKEVTFDNCMTVEVKVFPPLVLR